jgi:serpin B
MRSANMAFAQRGYPIAEAYIDRIGRTFGSGLGLVDYAGAPDDARAAINGWVSRQTAGRIPSLLDKPNVTSATRLVLANAVYLKAEWLVPFLEGDTRDRDFETADGTIRVPTMEAFGGQELVLARGDGWRATQLPYQGVEGGSPLAMTIVMPDDLNAYESHLSPSAIRRVDTAIRREQERQADVTSSDPENCGSYPYSLRLLLPKFGLDTHADLVPTLQTMGMRSVMDATTADLTGITDADRLFIASVVHQANIDVDERGTEAAAATSVGADTGGCTGPAPRETRTLRVDHPFLFLIRDVETGAILFMGRVTDPSD